MPNGTKSVSKVTEFCLKVDFVPLRNVEVPLGDDGTNVLETNCK